MLPRTALVVKVPPQQKMKDSAVVPHVVGRGFRLILTTSGWRRDPSTIQKLE
jgi:hypothetical protein